jgi:hypothetical protein
MSRICIVAWSWFSMLCVVVPLAALMMLALPAGVPVQVVAHVALLVAGAAIVLAVQPNDRG